jgi:hypothetical protein
MIIGLRVQLATTEQTGIFYPDTDPNHFKKTLRTHDL